MERRGASLALNTIGIAALVIMVVLVLGFIFFGYATRIIGIEDKCGEGVYTEYECVAERPEESGFTHCFITRNTMCVTPVADSELAGGQPLCCRR